MNLSSDLLKCFYVIPDETLLTEINCKEAVDLSAGPYLSSVVPAVSSTT